MTTHYNLIKTLVIVLIPLINLILPNSVKKKIGTTKNYSLKSERFHHEISNNIDLPELWGEIKYQVVTNQYGMRIGKNYKIDKNKPSMGFMGDSFVYGSGINYDGHFIQNLIDKNGNEIPADFDPTELCQKVVIGWEDVFITNEKDIMNLIDKKLPLPAYDLLLQNSHILNLLDSSQSISVTERQSYILKLRTMSNKIAESYIEIRKDLGFPLDKKQYEK